MTKCVNCGKEYEPKRSTSRYCSSKCRKLAFQIKVEKVSVPEVVDGKYSREYLPGGKYYEGCCYQDDEGNWHVRSKPTISTGPRADGPEVQAVWDKRNEQGQPAVYYAPYKPLEIV